MRVKNYNILTSGPQDLSSNVEFAPIPLEHIANYAIQLFFTGPLTGNFKLQASNDEAPAFMPSLNQDQLNTYITHWTDIADSAVAVTASGDIMWTVENAGYSYVRIVWTVGSGSGVLTSARSYVKGV